MQIPFLELKSVYDELREEIDAAVHRVLASGWYILGPEVEAFEQAYAAFVGAGHCIGVANGLDALTLALRAMDIGPGDEVIVPSNTYIATWLAVSNVGAVPVPVEPNPSTHNMDTDLIGAKIGPRTRAIIPVHLYGQPADLDPIIEIARAHGLKVLEDGAQCQGARYKGARIGAHGDAVAWSFFPTKNLGAVGDAGAVTTNSAGIADRLRVLRNYGSREKYVNEELGTNSRLDPLQAAVLSVKLRYLDAWNERRRQVATRYLAGLARTGIGVPVQPQWADGVWHQFVIRSSKRDALQRHLTARGIGTLIHYPIPPHRQRAYAGQFAEGTSLPVAEALAREVLSLPMSPHLSRDDQDGVIAALSDWSE